MTSRNIPAALVLALAALTGLTACQSTPTQESTGQYMDDTATTTKVKAAIFNEPSLKSAEINVETFKGVVQLRPTSPWRCAWHRAWPACARCATTCA
jgi:hypothetical protein